MELPELFDIGIPPPRITIRSPSISYSEEIRAQFIKDWAYGSIAIRPYRRKSATSDRGLQASLLLVNAIHTILLLLRGAAGDRSGHGTALSVRKPSIQEVHAIVGHYT